MTNMLIGGLSEYKPNMLENHNTFNSLPTNIQKRNILVSFTPVIASVHLPARPIRTLSTYLLYVGCRYPGAAADRPPRSPAQQASRCC